MDTTQTQPNFTRDELLQKLHHKEVPVSITFKKSDGTIREMLCTLNQDFIPKSEKPQTKSASTVSKPKRKNDDVIAVYDLEEEAWRSFRIDRVIKVV